MQAMATSLIVAKGESDETGLRIGDVVIINESGFSATGNPQDAGTGGFAVGYFALG